MPDLVTLGLLAVGALGAGGAGVRLGAGARRRRHIIGGLHLLLAVAALVGGRRGAT